MKRFLLIFVLLAAIQLALLGIGLLTKVFLPLIILPYAYFWIALFPDGVPYLFSDEAGMLGWWTAMLIPVLIFSFLFAFPIYLPLWLSNRR